MKPAIVFSLSSILTILSCSEEVPGKYVYDYPKPLFEDSLVSVPSSSIFLPILIRKNKVAETIREAIPKTIHTEEPPQKRKTQEYSLDADVVIGQTTLNGNEIIQNIKLRDGHGSASARIYHGRVLGIHHYSPWIGAKISGFRADLDAKISFNITEDYNIVPKASGKASIHNVKAEGLNVTGVLRLFGDHVRKDNFDQPIKDAITAMDIPRKVQGFWKDIQAPIEIAKDFYLFIEPDSIKYMKYIFGEDALRTGLGLDFKVTSGNKNDSKTWNSQKPLPRLKITDSIVEKNLDFSTVAKIPYSYINYLLKQKVEDNWIVKNDDTGKGKEFFKINELQLIGGSSPPMNLLVRAKATVLTSVFNTKVVYLYFNCNLKYDCGLKRIFVKDFELNTNTKLFLLDNFIEGIANNLLYSRIIKELEFDVQSEINGYLKGFNEDIKNGKEIGEDLNLKGEVNFVSIKDFHPGKDGLILTINGESDLEVLVQ